MHLVIVYRFAHGVKADPFSHSRTINSGVGHSEYRSHPVAFCFVVGVVANHRVEGFVNGVVEFVCHTASDKHRSVIADSRPMFFVVTVIGRFAAQFAGVSANRCVESCSIRASVFRKTARDSGAKFPYPVSAVSAAKITL
jgi:hypothetical protein